MTIRRQWGVRVGREESHGFLLYKLEEPNAKHEQQDRFVLQRKNIEKKGKGGRTAETK